MGMDGKREVYSALILQPEGTDLGSCHYQLSHQDEPVGMWLHSDVCCFDRCLCCLIYQVITK